MSWAGFELEFLLLRDISVYKSLSLSHAENVMVINPKCPENLRVRHGPSQSGPYSGVRDLLATFTLNLSQARGSAAAMINCTAIERV